MLRHHTIAPPQREKPVRGGRAAAVALFLCASAAPAHADAILFSNLGPGDSVTTGGLGITGPFAPFSEPARDLASGFVAPSGGRLSSIDVPLSWSHGVNGGDVWFMSDIGGLPGTILESWHVTDLPPFSDVAELVTLASILRPKVKDGLTYWLAASADDDTLLSWFVNSTGDTGVASRHGDGPWLVQDVPALAFRVNKGPRQDGSVPEPGLLLLSGVGGLGFYARRMWRRRQRTASLRSTIQLGCGSRSAANSRCTRSTLLTP
jgi:hypothetical protein